MRGNTGSYQGAAAPGPALPSAHGARNGPLRVLISGEQPLSMALTALRPWVQYCQLLDTQGGKGFSG